MLYRTLILILFISYYLVLVGIGEGGDHHSVAGFFSYLAVFFSVYFTVEFLVYLHSKITIKFKFKVTKGEY